MARMSTIAGRAEATDPACSLSPLREELIATERQAAHGAPPAFVYRRFGNAGASERRTTPELADASS